MKGLAITGVGMAVPDRVVTNQEVASRIGVEPDWIESRTGITQRRYAGSEDTTSTLGSQAARAAIQSAGISEGDIDLIVVATCTPDHLFPSTSALIQEQLGLSAGAFDLNAACSGFIHAMATSHGVLNSGLANRVLVVGAEVMSRFIDPGDPMTAPLFGDGAGAVVLEGNEDSPVPSFVLGSDGAGAQAVSIPGGGSRLPATSQSLAEGKHFIQMNGREVYRHAVTRMSEVGSSLGAGGFDLMIAHQANLRIIDECAARMGADRDSVFTNIHKYGNTSAASIPMAISEAWREGALAPGDRMLLLGFGAGYAWGGALVGWTLAPVSDESRPKAEVGSA